MNKAMYEKYYENPKVLGFLDKMTTLFPEKQVELGYTHELTLKDGNTVKVLEIDEVEVLDKHDDFVFVLEIFSNGESRTPGWAMDKKRDVDLVCYSAAGRSFIWEYGALRDALYKYLKYWKDLAEDEKYYWGQSIIMEGNRRCLGVSLFRLSGILSDSFYEVKDD